MTHPLACAALAALLALAAAHPATAQAGDFEGVITMRSGERPMDMQYYVRQGKIRIDVDRGGEQKGTSIIDPAARKVYVVMPERRMYMAMTIPNTRDAADDVELTKTGTSEVVAGHRCDYWKVHHKGSDAAEDADVCLASDIGGGFAEFGNPMRRGPAPPWQRALKEHGFPLKVVQMEDGKPVTRLEVTKIERKSLDASLFEPPADFRRMDMPATGH